MKGGENIGLQVCGDADPVVGNLDPRSIADPRQANFNHIPGGSEFGGIGDKVVQDLRHPCAVGEGDHGLLGGVDSVAYSKFLCVALAILNRRFNHFIEVHRLALYGDFSFA